jgi:hypothetical protein
MLKRTPKPITYHLQAAPLVTSEPTLGQPSTKSWNERLRAAWRERKALQTARKNAGAMVLRIVADEDLLDGLAALNWFLGRDRDDPEDVADAILDGLRKDILGE